MTDLPKLTAKPVPFSSTLGHAVMLNAADGRCIAMLAVSIPNANLPFLETSTEVQREVVAAINAAPAAGSNLDQITAAAQLMLGIYNAGAHDRAAWERIIHATAFAAEAYERMDDRDWASGAMLRAFLTALADPASPDLDYLRASAKPKGALASGAPDMAGALIRVRQIALQSEAAPLAMGEIVKRVDLALGEDTPLPAWMVETLAAEFAALAEVEALRAENDRLRAIIASCDWYWPDDDTSSDTCASSPHEVAASVGPGEVVGYSRGGVVESRYYAFLEAAPDAESDDHFEVDAATSEEAERLIAAELDRRATLAEEGGAA